MSRERWPGGPYQKPGLSRGLWRTLFVLMGFYALIGLVVMYFLGVLGS